MCNTFYHWIPISVLAEITKQSSEKLQKRYREMIQDDYVPLNHIPKNIQDIYVSKYLLRDRVIDSSFLDAMRNDSAKPLKCFFLRPHRLSTTGTMEKVLPQIDNFNNMFSIINARITNIAVVEPIEISEEDDT